MQQCEIQNRIPAMIFSLSIKEEAIAVFFIVFIFSFLSIYLYCNFFYEIFIKNIKHELCLFFFLLFVKGFTEIFFSLNQDYEFNVERACPAREAARLDTIKS